MMNNEIVVLGDDDAGTWLVVIVVSGCVAPSESLQWFAKKNTVFTWGFDSQLVKRINRGATEVNRGQQGHLSED